MRRLGILLFLFAGFCYAQETGSYHPSETNVWGSEYPRVDSTGRVQIRIKAPDATKVKVNFWSGPKVDMVKQPDGFWTVTTAPLVPGFHYYNLNIDGAEVSDPGTHAFFGGGRPASAVEVPEPGSTYYSAHDVPHGEVREVWYNSKVTGYLATRTGVSASEVRYAERRTLPGALPATWCRRGRDRLGQAGARELYTRQLDCRRQLQADDRRHGLWLRQTRGSARS